MTSPAAVPASQGGEETARLYRQYGAQLYRYCRARLRSREEAEDALQSIFVRVHGALLKGVKPRYEAAWLYKIAHNVCLSRSEVNGRRAKHESPIDPAELDWTLAAYDAKPDELFALPAALAEMPKNLRDAFLLREWQGLSYAEIADALDTTVSAVETLIFRARRQLAAALSPPDEKRPLRARIFDTGWVYGAARILFAQLRGAATIAAPAKLAAGVAVVAVGGLGVEHVVVATAADTPRDRSPAVVHASTLPSALTSATAKRSVAAARAPLRTGHPPARPRLRHVVAVTLPSALAPSTPAAEEPRREDPPAAAAAAPAPAVTTTIATATTAALPVAVPPVVVPPVDVPTVPVPTVTVPTVTVPTVTVPPVTLPSLP